jgi:CsoR family transcriptional regulator, copper-sensing transcriptional repressor
VTHPSQVGARGARLRAVSEAEAVEDEFSTAPASIDRADRIQQRLAVPVLIAALSSIPGVFLTLFDDPARTAGAVLNTLSGAVIVAEVVVLFAVSERKLDWLKRNRALVGLALLIAPAAVFAVGPVQLLRLVKVVGALRIVRVGRIFKAGRILRERAGLDEAWQRHISIGITLLIATFVALVLSDPTSHSRRVLDGAVSWLGITGVLLAGAVLAIATYVVRTSRDRKRDAD